MKWYQRYFLWFIAIFFAFDCAMAQQTKYKEIHKVKRKETIFGIARDNGLTVQELIDANPAMNQPGYELRKGEYIYIPFPNSTTISKPINDDTAKKINKKDVQKNPIKVGVMLPLHNINGDGRRMLEYYRGVLMACDSLRKDGISVDIHAWNVPEGADISNVLKDKDAARCDLLIGPLYSSQMKYLSDFATAHDIDVLIPFSINAPEIKYNPNLFQVYQSPSEYNDAVIQHFLKKFIGYHPVFIDCNDTTSKKGIFTFGLRRQLENMGRSYSITNLKSSEAYFAKAFSKTMPNIVILNTGRSPELNIAFAKINNLTRTSPGLSVTLFGYTEWMMYTKYNLDNYYKYNVYIPATFYTNPLSSKTLRIEQKYRWNFHEDMIQSLPRFAITGFDQAYFFIKGIYMYGKNFTGARGMSGYTSIQTPLHFERVGNGGYKNHSIIFVHYTPMQKVEVINY